MCEEEIIVWTGASGEDYYYWVFPIDFDFEKRKGNYIFCKEGLTGWVPLYIGQGDLSDRPEDKVHLSCALKRGATHIHAHLETSKSERRSEEKDLLLACPESYHPLGCNQRPGG